MTPSNFSFLQKEFALLHNLAAAAEYNLYTDPVGALVKLRQFGEKLTEFVFETHQFDGLAEPNFHAKIKVLEEENIFQSNIASLVHNIKHRGNIATHQVRGAVDDAKTILFSAFKLAKWFYQSYSEENADIADLKFSPPQNLDARHALNELEKQYASLEARFNKLLAEKEATELPEEKEAEIMERSAKSSKKIDLNEAETRELIDSQLRVAGWEVDSITLNYKLHKTLPQKGKNMAIAEWKAGDKWADYALFIGLDLYGIVEAKKYAQDISTDLRQSKVYASLVSSDHGINRLGEWQNYKVPFLFSTNGRPYLEQIKTKSGIWFLDARNKEKTSRPLQAWYSPKGVEEMFSRDIASANAKLEQNSKDFLTSPTGLGLREYQIRAIDKVEEAIINAKERKRALLAMATGTGKTRTIMGLCYRLIQSNRFKRILFLVDRTALGIQAINAFRDNKVDDLKTFADIYQVELLSKALPDVDTRLHFATVQSMVKRLFYKDDDTPGEIPTVDTYDCIIIDEAHRGYLLDREIDDGDLEFKNQEDYVSKYR